MNSKSKTPWWKIIGWAILIHVILIALSILEVFIYAQIHPGHEHSFYEDHAKVSGPYISIIFGFILFFFITRYFTKTRLDIKYLIAILLPVVYTIKDFLIVHFSGVDWGEHFWIFTISFLIKTLGAFLGAFSLSKKN